MKEIYNLPFWYDDPIELENVQQKAAGSFITGNEGWATSKRQAVFHSIHS